MNPKDAYLGNSSGGGSSSSSASVELAFEKAMKEAQIRRHETFTIEHVLLSLLDDASTQGILEVNDVNIEKLRVALFTHLESEVSSSSNIGRPKPHPVLGQVLRRAVMRTYLSNKKEAEGADILEAILAEDNRFAAQLLQDYGLTLAQTENQVLERYLAKSIQDTKKIETLLQKMEAQKTSADPSLGPHFVTSKPSSDQSKGDDVSYKNYVLRVTSKGREVIGFKAAVSHDGRLDLYIEETPFDIEFIASKVAALFEALEGGARLKVELVTEVDGQSRVMSGFEGKSGAIFEDPRSTANQKSGRL